MKTLAKDVILLCKGWYDDKKYPTILDALKQYYRKNYNDDMEEQLNESFLLHTILEQAMYEIADKYPDRLRYFTNQFLIDTPTLYIPDTNKKDYDYQLFYRIIGFLHNIRMRGDEMIAIDTNEYFRKNPKSLKEDII